MPIPDYQETGLERIENIEQHAAALTDVGTGGSGIANPLTSDLDGGGHDLINFSDVRVTGLTGATDAPIIIAGGNTSGAPATGDHEAGELAGDLTGKLWFCTESGTPGTWVAIGQGVGGDTWEAASPLGSDHRPAVRLLMSNFDTDASSTEHTSVVQSAIDAAATIIEAGVAANVEILFDSRMVYNIGASVTAGSNGQWSQIHWPYTRSNWGTITLRGMPSQSTQVGQGGENPTTIRSTLTSAPTWDSSKGIASIIGGPASYASPGITFLSKPLINIALYDICIRQAEPWICGIDAGMLEGFLFDNLTFNTDQTASNWANTNPGSITIYTHPQGVPFIAPQVNEANGCFGGTVFITNWPTGAVLGEGAVINNYWNNICAGAFLNIDAAYHANRINAGWDIDCAYGIANHDPSVTPGSTANYVVSTSATSRTSPAANSGPTLPGPGLDISFWDFQNNNGEATTKCNRVYDIWDANGVARITGKILRVDAGVGRVAASMVIHGFGDSATGTTAACVRDFGVNEGPKTAPAMPATNTYIRNPFSQPAFVTVANTTYLQTVLADGAKSLWTQGDTSGSTMTDVAGVSSGTYFNSPTQSQTSIPGVLYGNAVKYASASTQYATAPIVSGNTTTDLFTLEIWVKRTTTGAQMGLFNRVQSTGTPSGGPLIRFDSSDHIQILSSQVSVIGTSAGTLTDTSSFHHIVWTKNGSTNNLYLDGSDITPSISNVTFTAPGSGGKYEIAADGGSVDGGDPFNGTVAMAAVYRAELTSTQVLAHYNIGAGLVTAPTFSDVNIDGVSYGFGGNYVVPANAIVKVVYTTAPTWVWTTFLA